MNERTFAQLGISVIERRDTGSFGSREKAFPRGKERGGEGTKMKKGREREKERGKNKGFELNYREFSLFRKE